MKIYKTDNNLATLFFNSFFNHKDTSFKRYIFGHNQYSKNIIKVLLDNKIECDGIIDDFTTNQYYEVKDYKIPIIKVNDLVPHSLSNKSIDKSPLCIKVVVVVTSQTKSAIAKIQSISNDSTLIDLEYIDYFALQRASRESANLKLLELEFFDAFKCNHLHKNVSTWEDFRLDYLNHKNKYQEIFDRLQDEESKSQFEKIINFRLNSDYSFMKDFDFIPQEQYFEDFYDIDNVRYFFDIGAYRGETSLEFVKRNNLYQYIYYFEPDRQNFIIAKQNIESKLKNTKGFNVGLANTDDLTFFCSDSTSGHIISDINKMNNLNNHFEIQLCKLDTLLQEGKIEILDSVLDGGGLMLIKVDIESVEIEALKGMQRFITKYRPMIAICVYHSFDDFYKIPELVFSIRCDYKMYFRHYSSGLTESVMFFI
ncbi:FkbM family methyltransferase [Helicobacter sp. MIT 99-5507]|uniref:FkbM family methyltransferase n=1 Tax=Helicobacter sp. MIT 99-5507 TaxID=152489 RepID=UPI000E1EC67B|nr:FkbM family methyltransferase [Helicobacter sp. MIT 99-5507]RDU58604.1 hypothetical protein CQA42_02140 [Helicobacter sp. MIT 99-5507]